MENYHALGGDLWIIPLVLTLGSIAGFVYLYFQRKSGSTWWDGEGKKQFSSDKPPLAQCWGFWVGCMCGVSAIVSLILMYAAK